MQQLQYVLDGRARESGVHLHGVADGVGRGEHVWKFAQTIRRGQRFHGGPPMAAVKILQPRRPAVRANGVREEWPAAVSQGRQR